MVEIVNPQDALRERAVKATAQCGPCDFGMVEFGCSCSEEDPRAVITDLVRELEKYRTNAALLSASTMGQAYDRLEELLEKEKLVVEARALVIAARELALRTPGVHPGSPYVLELVKWLEKEAA